jgi:hypothetical protein
MRYARISADCHIDFPWLPPDLFTPNCSAALKDRMPYVAEGPDGPHWATKNVPSLGLTCSVGSRYVTEQFGHLAPDVVHKITCENAGKFYGLM